MRTLNHKTMLTMVGLAFTTTFCFSCSPFGDSTSPIGNSTYLRIHNASEYDLQNVEIIPYHLTLTFDDIKSGEKTQYVQVDRAYRYSFVKFFVDSVEFRQQPIDFVGETPLGDGLFTYKLTIIDLQRRIFEQTAVKD